MNKNRDQDFVDEIAKVVNCLPSTFIGGNQHLIDALKKFTKEFEELQDRNSCLALQVQDLSIEKFHLGFKILVLSKDIEDFKNEITKFQKEYSSLEKKNIKLLERIKKLKKQGEKKWKH